MSVLSQRALNRATLARQHLLDRTSSSAFEVIEQLGGMQSQAPLAPYLGLWSRLSDFSPDELSGLMMQRRVVRAHLMRNTLHLVSARDCLGWRPLFEAQHAAEFRAHFGGVPGRVDLDELLRQSRRLLEERPRTRAELGRLLAKEWPEVSPSVLAYAVSHHLALCQVPPRGVWGKNGPAAWVLAETWLHAPLKAVAVDELVLRYLDAFGPAQVADVQLWSGLTGLREVVERLPLRAFRGEQDEMLYDLPNAPRPVEDVPAPPRMLPAYDNLLLSHADRSRVIPDGRAVPLPPGNGATTGTFLVDGMWQGTWEIRDQALQISPFTELDRAGRDALLAEAEGLYAFVQPEVRHEVVFRKPAE